MGLCLSVNLGKHTNVGRIESNTVKCNNMVGYLREIKFVFSMKSRTYISPVFITLNIII